MTDGIYGLQWDTTGPLPFQADLHAYYLNGKYATKPISYGKGKVWIDVIGDGAKAARWLDVENEDATPAMVPTWLDQRFAAAGDGDGGIYCNLSTLPTVLTAAGDRKFDLWIATLDGTIYPYAVNSLSSNVRLCCVQAFPASYIGINADLSLVMNQDYWNTYAL